MTEQGREEEQPSFKSTGGLLFGAGSVTQGQLVALTSVTLVLLLLLAANMAVYALYRSAVRGEEENGEGERHRHQRHRHKTANLWVYRLHRTTTPVTSTPTESASQQILRKLQLSHHNLQARLAAADDPSSSQNDDKDNSLRREEAQALEELEVTTDLFRHEASSCSSSRRSSLSAFSGRAGSSRRSTVRELLLLRGQMWRGGGVSAFSRRKSTSEGRSEQHDPNSTLSDLDPDWDFDDDAASTHQRAAAGDDAGSAMQDSAVATHGDPDPSYDLDVAVALADLDMASALHDLDLDKVSMSSVTLADFENDPADFVGTPGKKRTRRSRSRSSSRGSHDRGDHSRSLPVAEFHNEAFEFSETRAAVERMNDVEL